MTRLRLCLDDVDGHPALDTAIARVLLERVDAGELPATLRLSRPARLVAFSSRDARTPGFDRAVEASQAAGFAPVVRLAGGRPAVFTPSTIAFAWSIPAEQPTAGIGERFEVLSSCLVEALLSLGLDARVGEVPGEYCPGSSSVNLAGTRKVAGVGQRLLRRAAHTGGVVVVDDAAAINRVLTPVYAALGLSFDPAVTGQLRSPGRAVTFEDARQAIAAAFGRHHELEPWRLDAETLARAEASLDHHLPARQRRR
ncbi:MAG: biotin/lipoate A/B protein ligase family protein [Nitriliruptoraceae bacterium]